MKITIRTTEPSNNTTNNKHSVYTHKSKQNSDSKKNSFLDKLYRKRNPRNITYNEYKNLTREDIDILYPKDTMIKQNNEATSLYIKAHITDDEVLNKVLFEKELESFESSDALYLESLNKVVNTIFDAWSSITYLGIQFEAIAKHLESFAMNKEFTKDYTIKDYSNEFSKNIEVTVKNIKRTAKYSTKTVCTSETEITTNGLFNTFDSMIKQFDSIQTKGHYDTNSNFYKGSKTVTSYLETIKDDYYKRKKENDKLLHCYTQTCSYTHVEYADKG